MKTFALVLVVALSLLTGCAGFAEGVKDGAAAEGGQFVADVATDAVVDRLPQSGEFDELKSLIKELPKQLTPVQVPVPVPVGGDGSNLPGYGLGAFLGAAGVALLKGLGRKKGWWGDSAKKSG